MALPDEILIFFQNIREIGIWNAIRYSYNKYILKKGIFKITPKKYFYPLYLRRNTSDFVIFEQIISKRGYKLMYNTPCDSHIILDCGANIGLFTLFCKRQYPEAKIIAVEPENSNYEILEKNTAKYNDIICLKNGIWSKNCFLKIKDKNADKWGFRVEECVDKKDIEAITINDIINEFSIQQIDILKIDIEGSEKQLFESGDNHWLNLVRLLIVELHDDMTPGCSGALFRALDPYNFSTYFRGDNIFIYFNRN